ncbi:unnamed protein product [Ilex paraguariensis]
MSYYVPDFEMDEDYPILSSSSGLTRSKKSAMAEEDDLMELLWQNGQVVVQSQNQRSSKKSHVAEEAVIPAPQSSTREIRSENETTTHLFMQEEEMASWLHYPIDESSFDREIYADLFCTTPCALVTAPSSREVRPPLPPVTSGTTTVASRPPVPPARRAEVERPAMFQSFTHSIRPKGRMASGPSSSNKAVRESTVVDSNDTPSMGPESRVSRVTDSVAQVSGAHIGVCRTMSGTDAAGTSSAAMELATTCELTMTSSSNNSGGSVSASAEPVPKPTPEKPEDRKRKEKEFHSEDVEFESADAKKQVRGSITMKRSRAAEVHNLSERRRRDRINEKMRALQELIPRCNKSDKASMLDEAIEYLKSLQLQVQMMSMGCSMVPMIFPGIQQYMPPMGMGMGMGMGMNQPMVPFPSVLPGSTLPTPPGSAHLGPRFSMPAFHMPPVPLPDASRIQATNQPDPISIASQNPNQPQIPNFADSAYQQYIGLRHMQVQFPQTQAVVQPGHHKPGRSKEVGKSQNPQAG